MIIEIDIDIDISDVMANVFQTQFLALNLVQFLSMVPFKISGIIPGVIPGSIPGAMLDVF